MAGIAQISAGRAALIIDTLCRTLNARAAGLGEGRVPPSRQKDTLITHLGDLDPVSQGCWQSVLEAAERVDGEAAVAAVAKPCLVSRHT